MCLLELGLEVLEKVQDDAKLSQLMLDVQDLKLDKIIQSGEDIHKKFCESEVMLNEIYKLVGGKVTKEEAKSLEGMCQNIGIEVNLNPSDSDKPKKSIEDLTRELEKLKQRIKENESATIKLAKEYDSKKLKLCK